VKRAVAVVSTSRADYSHLYWVLHELREHPEIELKLLVSGAHLSSQFGHTVDEIERDGFRVDARVECLHDADDDVGMAKTIGTATLGLADVLGQMRPDLLLLIADRYEMLAPASVALALRIPIAHIEGGDVSEGAIDDAVRNALTKLSHIHFTPTENAQHRVLAMGEERWRVHRVGAPSLDHLRRSELPDRAELEKSIACDVPPDSMLVSYHPVTIARDTLREADEVFAALEQIKQPIFFCFPNADAGGRKLIRRAQEFCGAGQQRRLFVNLNPLVYWSLLKNAGVMVGNSSSGIMETPSLALPTVNIGLRQEGRERARNILDVPADRHLIVEGIRQALDPRFRESLAGMTNPYGDGHAAERIAAILAEVPLGEELLHKRPVAVSGHEFRHDK
jgi:UDP-N-acetylglucosamine 2-epimerase (non-hydrolysing)/GDP/UDP-N,N'-diacetylbacillosamine 2-epimerase (hydrolysing)